MMFYIGRFRLKPRFTKSTAFPPYNYTAFDDYLTDLGRNLGLHASHIQNSVLDDFHENSLTYIKINGTNKTSVGQERT